MEEIKKQRGGRREGAGRKKVNVDCTYVGFNCPKDLLMKIDRVCGDNRSQFIVGILQKYFGDRTEFLNQKEKLLQSIRTLEIQALKFEP